MNPQIKLDEELADLRGHLRVCIDGKEVRHVPQNLWLKRCHGLSPQTMYQRFAGAGGNDAVRVQVNFFTTRKNALGFDEDGSVDIRHNVGFDAEDTDNLIRFKWFNSTGTIARTYLRDQDQNQHICKHYMKAGAETMRNMGMKAMAVHTTGMGSYVWAKYGFVPDDSTLHWVHSQIEDAFYDGKNCLLREKLRDTLTNAEKKVIKYFLDAPPAEQRELFTQLAELNRVVGTLNDKPLTLGKALLFNTGWSGTMPLDDNDRGYQRFCDYVDMVSVCARGKYARA